MTENNIEQKQPEFGQDIAGCSLQLAPIFNPVYKLCVLYVSHRSVLARPKLKGTHSIFMKHPIIFFITKILQEISNRNKNTVKYTNGARFPNMNDLAAFPLELQEIIDHKHELIKAKSGIFDF